MGGFVPDLKVLLQAARPKTLPAAICPVVIGGALAGRFDWLFWLVLFTAIHIQVATNFANDLYDHKKGADTPERQGPTRVTAAGLATEAQMYRALLGVISVCVLCGLIIVLNSHWAILVLGIVSLLLTVGYTTGPFPLSYLGIADLFVIVFFGPVAVAGTYFVLSGEVTSFSIIAGLCIGMLSTAILVVNNTRDIEEDTKSGKKTLQSRFGLNFARAEYVLLLLVPSLMLNEASQVVFLLLSLVLAALFYRAKSGGDYNRLLGLTSLQLILFTVLLSAGV